MRGLRGAPDRAITICWLCALTTLYQHDTNGMIRCLMHICTCSRGCRDRKFSRNQTINDFGKKWRPNANAHTQKRLGCPRAFSKIARRAGESVATTRILEAGQHKPPRAPPRDALTRARTTKVMPRCVRGFANRVAKMGTALRRERRLRRSILRVVGCIY